MQAVALPADFRLGFENGADLGPVTLAWTGAPRPDWLTARLVKNGPGLFAVGEQRYRHWFDGLALLLQFDIGREIVFRSRFLRSPDFVATSARQRISYTEFATVPRRNWLQRVWCTVDPLAQFGANASINIATVDGEVIAIGDLPGGLDLDADTLDVAGSFDLRKPPMLLTTTPHPQRDDAAKAWFNVGIAVSRRGFGYQVFALPDGSRRAEPLAFIRRSSPAYMHSVGMSQRYVVVIEHPMFASLARFFTLGLRNRPIIDAFRWSADEPLTFFVVDKAHGHVAARVEVPAAFYFHSSNVFDDGDDVVIDLCTYPDDRVIDELDLDHLRGPDGGRTTPSKFLRHRIHVPTGTVTTSALTDASVEFPTTNPGRLHASYRYTYAAGLDAARPDDYTNQLVKVDLTNGTVVAWSEPGCYPTEPVMVPRPGATKEDDGVVLCVVLDAHRPASMLLALDARSFTEIGRAYVPAVIPFGLHGQALPSRTGARP